MPVVIQLPPTATPLSLKVTNDGSSDFAWVATSGVVPSVLLYDVSAKALITTIPLPGLSNDAEIRGERDVKRGRRLERVSRGVRSVTEIAIAVWFA